MDLFKRFFSFLHYTATDSSGKVIYTSTSIGGATSNVVPKGGEMFLGWLLPYVPLLAVVIAALKLCFDFVKWRKRDG